MKPVRIAITLGLMMAGGAWLAAAAEEEEQPRERPRAERALNEELEKLRLEVREQEAAGHADKAEALRRQIERLRDQVNSRERERREPGRRAETGERERPGLRREPVGPESPRWGRRMGPGPGPLRFGPGVPERRGLEVAHMRLRHLQEAIEHLRMAGMPEVAARLQREAEGWRQRMQEAAPGEAGSPRPEARPIEELRNQVQELRSQLEQLRAQVQELHQRR